MEVRDTGAERGIDICKMLHGNKHFTPDSKQNIYEAMIQPVMTYGAVSCWCLKNKTADLLP